MFSRFARLQTNPSTYTIYFTAKKTLHNSIQNPHLSNLLLAWYLLISAHQHLVNFILYTCLGIWRTTLLLCPDKPHIPNDRPFTVRSLILISRINIWSCLTYLPIVQRLKNPTKNESSQSCLQIIPTIPFHRDTIRAFIARSAGHMLIHDSCMHLFMYIS